MMAAGEATITRVNVADDARNDARARLVDAVTAIDHVTAASPWSATTIAAEFARDDRCYLVAGVDGEVVGYAGFAVLAGDAHVMAIAVHPDHQRHGIGRLLLTALLDAATTWGVSGVTLEVRADDVRTRQLYRRAGFVEEGRRPDYYGDGVDAIIAWKR